MVRAASSGLAALACIAAQSHAAARLPPAASFNDYVQFFGRTYDHDSAEGKERRALFEQRAMEAQRQNSRPDASWRATLNEFADWKPEELQRLQGWRATPSRGTAVDLVDIGGSKSLVELPDDFPESKDWGHLESLSEVPDQGGCGSCWAVATTYLLRTRFEIAAQVVKPFSVQHLIICTPNPHECGGRGGCDGATVELALDYVSNITLDMLAVDTDPISAYLGTDGACSDNKKAALLATSAGRSGLRGIRQHETSLALTSYQRLPPNKPVPLLLALVEGPVAISVAAGPWFSYSDGVFDGCTGPDGWIINHAVLMVGFGMDADSGKLYWRLMNSWSSHWGEQGFMRLLRRTPEEDAKSCGWDTHPKEGVACKPYPEKSWACGMCGLLFDSVAPQLS